MLYKRQRIIRKAVIIYELPDTVKGYASTVKGNLYNKKYVFKRITDDIKIFNCSGCILEGKCDRVYTIHNGIIKNYCREQDKFFGIKIYYKCCSEETIKQYTYVNP